MSTLILKTSKHDQTIQSLLIFNFALDKSHITLSQNKTHLFFITCIDVDYQILSLKQFYDIFYMHSIYFTIKDFFFICSRSRAIQTWSWKWRISGSLVRNVRSLCVRVFVFCFFGNNALTYK